MRKKVDNRYKTRGVGCPSLVSCRFLHGVQAVADTRSTGTRLAVDGVGLDVAVELFSFQAASVNPAAVVE